ncbi:MAG: acyl-CoA thioesterase II [Actinomycetota bacterium]|nr:acyl-CoA thioesterase II [Actinomycetota bacterium]
MTSSPATRDLSEPVPVVNADFTNRLMLRRIDRDIFTGHSRVGGALRTYGGQVAAQSVMAAGMTVDDPERRVHSLHGYFLRPGKSDDRITYLVERVREGGSFSSRIVRAVQNGETIFLMTASFSTIDPGPEHQFQMPAAPPPEEGSPEMMMGQGPHSGSDPRTDDQETSRKWIDLRLFDQEKAVEMADGRYERMAWVRIRQELPDDPLIQACALTYLSDLTMVPTALSPNIHLQDQLQMASIDHAMWFHAPIRTDQWLLFAQDTPVARGGHGLARGLFYEPDGTLIASVVQEGLMRAPRKKA